MPSVLDFGWLYEGRTGTFGVKASREFSVNGWLSVDDRGIEAKWLYDNELRIPRIGAAYAHGLGADPGARVKSVQLTERGQSRIWDFGVGYSSAIDEQQQEENPMLREPEVNYDFNPRETALQRAFDGPEADETGYRVADDFGSIEPTGEPAYKAVLNSSDEIFEDPLMDYEIDAIITIERNEPTFNLIQAHWYMNTINKEQWWGLPPRFARLHMIKPQYTVEGIYKFFRVKYEIHVGVREWIRQVLDVGYREKIVTEETDEEGNPIIEYKPLLDADGNHLSKPVKLDGNGRKLAEGRDPVFLKYYTYRRRDFGKLALRGPRVA